VQRACLGPRRSGVLPPPHPRRPAGESRVDCRVGRARLRAGPTPSNSPGGEGDRAEGRTPFAALSAGARGGLMERSDLPTADTSRTPPHLHQARAGAFSLPAQCLPLTLASAPAGHATPAQGAAPGPVCAAALGGAASGAARKGRLNFHPLQLLRAVHDQPLDQSDALLPHLYRHLLKAISHHRVGNQPPSGW